MGQFSVQRCAGLIFNFTNTLLGNAGDFGTGLLCPHNECSVVPQAFVMTSLPGYSTGGVNSGPIGTLITGNRPGSTTFGPFVGIQWTTVPGECDGYICPAGRWFITQPCGVGFGSVTGRCVGSLLFHNGTQIGTVGSVATSPGDPFSGNIITAITCLQVDALTINPGDTFTALSLFSFSNDLHGVFTWNGTTCGPGLGDCHRDNLTPVYNGPSFLSSFGSVVSPMYLPYTPTSKTFSFAPDGCPTPMCGTGGVNDPNNVTVLPGLPAGCSPGSSPSLIFTPKPNVINLTFSGIYGSPFIPVAGSPPCNFVPDCSSFGSQLVVPLTYQPVGNIYWGGFAVADLQTPGLPNCDPSWNLRLFFVDVVMYYPIFCNDQFWHTQMWFRYNTLQPGVPAGGSFPVGCAPAVVYADLLYDGVGSVTPFSFSFPANLQIGNNCRAAATFATGI